MVRCAVLCRCGGLQDDEHGTAVTVPTKNPNRFEVDPQPEPDQATWAKLSITAEGSDGGIVDAEIIRPRSWILRNGICAGRMLPFNLPELEVSGLALVTSIDECPPIADGEGSVVTARFVTSEVHVVASVDVLGADGSVETITGTTIHPVWSVDRQEWVPLAELAQGERLQGLDGLAVVLGVSLSRVSQPVYNIEVHGEHVYQVGDLGLVVHNNSAAFIRVASGHGGKILPASTLRTIRKGEKVDDLVRELAQATYESGGLEHAIVSLRNGTRIIVRGGSGGIELGDDVKRVIMHTHPRTTGPSAEDFDMLRQLGQRHSYIYELFGGGLSRFGL